MGDGDTNVVQKRGDTAKFDSINRRISRLLSVDTLQARLGGWSSR